MKILIAISVVLMLSVGITVARQIQGQGAQTIQGDCLPCQQKDHNPDEEDSREVLCPLVADSAAYIRHMVDAGYYEQGKDGDDPTPQEILRRLTHLEEEWCPGGPGGDWEAGGFDFHFLTALSICAFGILFAIGIPYAIVSFVAVTILIGLSVFGITSMVLLEFGLDYASEISEAYWHCVDILTG
jgi:hypothetical protein